MNNRQRQLLLIIIAMAFFLGRGLASVLEPKPDYALYMIHGVAGKTQRLMVFPEGYEVAQKHCETIRAKYGSQTNQPDITFVCKRGVIQ